MERYEEENRMKKQRYKFINNADAKVMALEQFGVLSQKKEWQITESVVLTKQTLSTYFVSLGYQSRITDNIIEYVLKAAPKLTFKAYFKLLAEGIISTCPYVYNIFR